MPLHPSSVLLVSGGAKGITAQCVIALAKRYQCRFILLGRSSLTQPDPAWDRDITDEVALKKRIMEDFLAQGEQPTPLGIQAVFDRMMSRQAIEKTLQAIEQAGGQAMYCRVDITQHAALQAELAKTMSRLGPITGIIHGAGALADKPIEKKSVQDFESVYTVKVKGLENLLKCVPASQLEYVILFSSVVGFYGNVGQADYALANEILNKAAYLIKRQYPSCHVMALNWGPWDGGMVSPELKKVFMQRDIQVIPPEVGVQMFVDEFAPGNHDLVQVILGSPLTPASPAFDHALQTFRLRRTLSLEGNPFLLDHTIGAYAVLPATCALAWMANACEQLYPGYTFFSCTHFKALKGIVFDASLANPYTLELTEVAKITAQEIVVQATVWSKTAQGSVQYHYSGQIQLLRHIPVPPSVVGNDRGGQEIAGQSLYHNGTLFHGPCFQGVNWVGDISLQKLTLQGSLPSIGERIQGQFPVQTFNPYIADVQLQGALIWTQHVYQAGCLPSSMQKLEQYKPICFDESFTVIMEITAKTETSVVVDVTARNSRGELCTRVLGLQGTISKRLNRLFSSSIANRDS